MTYKREDRHHRALGMTPSVARQASALLYVHEQSISLLHPLTEEALEHWPADTITQLVVNSGTQSLQLHVCDTCRPKDGGLVLVTCPTPAQQPATSMITSLPLQSCVRRSERELICEFVHVCEVQIPSNPDSRCPSSMSKGGSSLCGSCGSLFESSILSPQAVGQLMKTSACQQLSSIYSPGSLHGSRSLHEDSDRPGADPEGYMIMKSDDQAEKLDRSGTLPTRNNAPLPDTFRRTKSATFNSHTRLHRVSGHQNVAPARSWNSSARRNSPEAKPSKLASSEGESTYMEPTEVLRHRSHLPDCVPQLKPSAERTTSDQSYVSTNPSEHYASSTAHSRKTSVTSTQFEDSGHRETSESSNDTPRSSIVEEDISDTDEDGYSFMAFPEPAKPILRPSKSSKPDRALNAVDKSGLIKAAQRTRSSPSMLANATYPPRAGCPPTPRTRIASPSFSELERRAAVATAKVQQRRDEERGYVTPEPVTHRHHHHPKANSSSASLPLQLVTDPNHPDGSYMTLVGNGARFPRKSESTSALPTSGSPDSGIGPETLGSCESDGRYTNRAAIIKKRVRRLRLSYWQYDCIQPLINIEEGTSTVESCFSEQSFSRASLTLGVANIRHEIMAHVQARET